MDKPREYHTEWSKSDREGEISWHPFYVESKKKRYKRADLQNRKKLTFRKQTHSCWGEGIVTDFWKVMYTLLYLKWITNKNLCIPHGTLLSVMCQPGWEAVWGEKGYMHMYGWVPFYSPETITTLLISCTPIQNVLGVKKRIKIKKKKKRAIP